MPGFYSPWVTVSSSPSRRAASLALALCLATASNAQQPAAGSEDSTSPAPEPYLTSVLELQPNGRARRLDAAALAPLPGPNPVVSVLPSPNGARRLTLYFDSAISSTATVRSAARAFAQQLDKLVALGEVEIVLASPEPRSIAGPSRDPELLDNALQRLFLRTEAEDALRQRRRRFLDGPVQLDASGRPISQTAPVQETVEQRSERAREAIADEIFMLRTQRDELVQWLAQQPLDPGRSHLVLVQEALGLDPLAFYLDQRADNLAEAATGSPTATEVADVAAAYGWTLHPFVPGADDTGPNLRYTPSDDVPVGFRLRLGRDREDDDEPEVGDLLLEPPVTAWPVAAARAGGVPVERDAVDRFLDQVGLMAMVSTRGGDPRIGVTLGPAQDSRVRLTPAALPVGHHPLVSEIRLQRAFDGAELTGAGLRLEGRFLLDATGGDLRSGLLDASASTDGEDGLGLRRARSEWRLTLLFADLEEETTFRSLTVGPSPAGLGVAADAAPPTEEPENPEITAPLADLQPAAEDGSEPAAIRFRAPLRLPEATTTILVLAENLASGEWGLTTADIASRETTSTQDESERRRALRIVPPTERELSGRVTFEVQTQETVDRVVYYLNGKRVARRRRAPFDVTINLGSSTRTMQLVAAAYDRNGNELDRDRLLLNEPPEAFWVRFVEPEPGADVAGATQVSARLRVPEQGAVERLEFFWRDQSLATLSEPPWQAEVPVPVGQPDGFLRVEARLRDGRLAEDVLLVNQGGFGEQIGVELVELYVVATGRDNKPVRGLEEDAFEVFEDGSEQEIESFEPAGDLPLTVGLAIDTSSSLFLRMPEVSSAAARFVRSLEDDRDRAFLIEFGDRPQLVAGTTRDLGQIRNSILALEPYGTTAVWGAIDMSLQQLDGISGRKALVVFYDGDDEDEQRNFERSLKLARRTSVPIYLVLMNDMAARTQGRSLSSRSFVGKLERITRTGGGRVYYVGKSEDLDPIFDAIAEELRSHYLLTYYPEARPGGPLWRPVEVRVNQRGVSARTIEGRGLDGY